MGRKSSIAQLPQAIRQAVDEAIREGRATIEDIVSLVKTMGGSASASAVGRYKANAEEQMGRYREAQEVAKVWVERLGNEPEGDVARLLPEMLRTVAFGTIGSLDGADANEVMLLARAIKDLASADKLTAERILRVRREVADKAAVEAVKEAKRAGLSDEAAEAIKRKILGVV